MRQLSYGIDAFNAAIGRATSYLIFVMMGVIMVEIISRSVFSLPTSWVHDVSGWLQVFYVFLGGAWALQKGYLVRVDIIYQELPVRAQAAIDLFLSTVLFAAFAYVMIRNGSMLAMRSYDMGEVSANGAWGGPVYPAKFMIPLGMVLLSLSWLARCLRQAIRLVDSNALPPETESEGGA